MCGDRGQWGYGIDEKERERVGKIESESMSPAVLS
jgi:hypothetical protein